jgi:deazaflavin-dependent oxidoreductase (nitroreductase family)
MAKYQKPDAVTTYVMNPIIAGLTKLGLSVKGSAVLSVRGRKSGEWRSTPVNPLTFNGERYLVAPRGDTQWVRKIRVSGSGRLQVGRKTTAIRVAEIPDSEKIPLLRAYFKEWKWEVGKFFDLKSADAPDAELARIAPDHPVFRIDE